MSVWSAAWRVADTLLGLAMWADERRERRKARQRLAELGAAMDRDERRRAATVILPRPTTPPAASGGASPTAPSTPPRRR